MVEGDNAAAIDSAKNQLDRTPGDSGMFALLDGYLAQNPNDGFFQYKRAMADAIDFRDGKPDDARRKLEKANRRANPQDMRTMLEDEFFRDHIQVNPGTNNAPADREK
jgi:hypothetical protein